MPDEEKESGIWGKLILGVVTALLVGGTTPWWWDKVFGKQEPVSTSPTGNSSSSAKPVKNETLTVYAESTKGTSWLNKENNYVKVNFEATGEWLAIPENLPESGVPDHAKGYLSPNGDPNFNSNSTMCARAPLGALVVIGEDRQCKAYGAKGSLELKPRETVVFMMNDVPNLYPDNRGQIVVKLSASKE